MMFSNTQVDVLVYSSRNPRNQNGLGALRRTRLAAQNSGAFLCKRAVSAHKASAGDLSSDLGGCTELVLAHGSLEKFKAQKRKE